MAMLIHRRYPRMSFKLIYLVQYTEWPKISENIAIYDSVIVDLMPVNFTY